MATSLRWMACAAVVLAACGGGLEDEATPVPVGARAAAAAADSVSQEDRPLAREVFSYTGGSRDPFESALTAANLGPELADLTLVAVYLDLQDPQRGVAVLRDRITGRRYTVHQGDRLGRARVELIQERTVTFRVDDFGVERQEVLSLRKAQEDTP